MPSGVFPKVSGELIYAADYNSIQSVVDSVMGLGSTDEGYGQAITSSQLVPSTTAQVIQWVRLRNDMILARQHQTGVDESASLTVANSSSTISFTIANQYYNFAQTIRSNRLTLAASGNSSTETLVDQTRTASWNGTLTHTVTITFPGYTTGSLVVSPANHARAFFNAGGKIWISSGRSGGTVGSPKNIDWTTMLGNGSTQPSGFGTVEFGYTETNTVAGTASAAGTTYNIGWYDMTTSDQLVFRKQAPAGNYAENDYEIYARKNAGSTQLILSIQFKDDDTGDASIDEDVDGNLRSFIRQVRPSGSNVSVPTPTATGSGLL
jgi:hypothetical protein